jgi:hypothetical protein
VVFNAGPISMVKTTESWIRITAKLRVIIPRFPRCAIERARGHAAGGQWSCGVALGAKYPDGTGQELHTGHGLEMRNRKFGFLLRAAVSEKYSRGVQISLNIVGSA